MNWYLKVIAENYVNFDGRARRKEYWMFTLIHFTIMIGIVFISGAFSNVSDSFSIPIILLMFYFLGTFLPSIAVTIRRLHDTGKSGWYYLVSFIPYIGGIWLLVLTIIEGDSGPNEYGPDPKGNFDEIDEIGVPIED